MNFDNFIDFRVAYSMYELSLFFLSLKLEKNQQQGYASFAVCLQVYTYI
jgi:hypothetical protein